jgi:Ca-activated chloride channel family protein
MKINPDDPKWTAYVLGELSEAERAEIEKELESSAAAREAVDEIRLTTLLLKDELAKEPALGLTPAQKHAIAAAATAGQPESASRYTGWFGLQFVKYATAAAAALFIVASISIPLLVRSRSAVSPVAMSLERDAAATDGTTASIAQQQKPALADADAPPQELRQLNRAAEAEGRVARLEADQIVDAVVVEPQSSKMTYGAALAGTASNAPSSFAAPPPPGTAPAPAPDILDRPRFNTEAYDLVPDNPFIPAAQEPVATFSIDVDTASYANVRRFITQNQLPPKDAVRIEEMINYFTYDDAPPAGPHPIAAYAEVAAAPWQPAHRLVRVAIKAKDVDLSKRPASNLVFLIDVSASMNDPRKLPLLKSSMKLMIDKLEDNDRVAMVVYAGASGLVLPPTSGQNKTALIAAIDRLESGGSTNGAAGIRLAYDTAVANFIKGGINRVILATDGDFNVGVTSQGDLTRLIEDRAKSGVFLTVLGFGMGNLKDSTLERLADRGNGNYAYIDTLAEAQKVLVEGMGGTLMTIAKDVKVQIEFNTAEVNAYRLIGYENRVLRPEDFNNDAKDAGDMGAGHAVTALFEVVPKGVEMALPTIEPLRYREAAPAAPAASRRDLDVGIQEMLNIKIRYKEPDGTTSRMIDFPIVDRKTGFNTATTDLRFAAAVASFGMILRDSPHQGQSSLNAVIDMAEKSRGADKGGYREEFIQLVRKAATLKKD